MKTHLKQVLILMLALTLLCGMVACTGKPAENNPEDTGNKGSGETTTADNGNPLPPDSEDLLIASEQKFYYEIVKDGGYVTDDQITDIITELESYTGGKISKTAASKSTLVKLQIVVGNAGNVKEVSQALQMLNADQYGVLHISNKVVVTGHTPEAMEKAIAAFKNLVKDSVTLGADGNGVITLKGTDLVAKTISDRFGNFKKPATTLKEAPGYDLGNGSIGLHYTGVTADNVTEYLATLAADGFATAYDRTLESNRYVTLANAEGRIHINYVGAKQDLTVISEKLDATDTFTAAADGEVVTNGNLALIALNYAGQDANNGMGESMVVTLPDGRFVVIDGGFAADETILYNYLTENGTKEATIAAWFLTHAHTDHYMCFNTFMNSAAHQQKVHVENIIANPVAQSNFSESGTWDSAFDHLADKAKTLNAKFVKAHTGDQFVISDVTFDVLYTHENYYMTSTSGKIGNLNEASLVIKVSTTSKSVLLLGDVEDGIRALNMMYTSQTLQSDAVQVNHHAYPGPALTPAEVSKLYTAINPSVAMFTTNQATFTARMASTSEYAAPFKALNEDSDIVKVVADGENYIYALFSNPIQKEAENTTGFTDGGNGMYVEF